MPPASKAKPKAKRPSPSLEQRRRMKKNKCGKQKSQGGICTKPAGWGTDHPGSGACKNHGGASRNGNTHAARGEAHGMSKPLNVTPGQAILGILKITSGQLAYTMMKIGELGEDDTFEEIEGPEGGTVAVLPNRWIRLQAQLKKEIDKYARSAADMGIAERQQSLAEFQTQMFKQMLEAVVGDLNLTQQQRKALGPAIRKAMPSLIEGTAEEVPA